MEFVVAKFIIIHYSSCLCGNNKRTSPSIFKSIICVTRMYKNIHKGYGERHVSFIGFFDNQFLGYF
jgi:hypothetical protein